jgi:transcriptional antiterminator RfaH
MTIFRTGWYVIYTKPYHEKKVHDRLTEKKIETFLPTRKTLRTWHDRRKFIDEPLFPSYLFIHLNSMQEYYEGMDARGVLNYVRTGKEIAQVSDSVVQSIKLVTNQASELEISDNRFQPGKRLVINQGSLAGLSCEVVENCGRCRILVRVDLLQRHILIKLPENYLLAI